MSTKATKLLICDDDDDVRTTLEWFLSQGDFEVVMAASGQEALALLKQAPVDLILLDLVMPVLGGFEVLTRLKLNPATQGIPVVILTAIDDTHKMNQCLRMGAFDYVVKPLDIVSLRRVLQRALAGRSTHGPAPGSPPQHPVPEFSSDPVPHSVPTPATSPDLRALKEVREATLSFLGSARSSIKGLHHQIVESLRSFPEENRLRLVGRKLAEVDALLEELQKMSDGRA